MKRRSTIVFLNFSKQSFEQNNNYFLPTYTDTILIKPDSFGGFWLNIMLLREYYPHIANQLLVDYRNKLVTIQNIITEQIRLYV